MTGASREAGATVSDLDDRFTYDGEYDADKADDLAEHADRLRDTERIERGERAEADAPQDPKGTTTSKGENW